ncbi:hypothetical protein [Actinomadura sp. DC4]|nr:hypothetical protein [Actinomadura sp. DC4]MDN3358241.1 hypothetical protein [Actinomadura sp. DC4]
MEVAVPAFSEGGSDHGEAGHADHADHADGCGDVGRGGPMPHRQ